MTLHPVALTPALIVEDDDGDRRRIQGLLEGLVAGDRIDWAGDLASARARLAGGGYALALVDVQLPDGSGIDLIGWIGAHAPHTAAVIVSSWAAEDTVLAGIRAGAIGYLLKSGSDEELRIALRSLARGGAPVDPLIARRILEMVSAVPPARGDPHGPEAAPPPLSGRESEILHLVARGLSNREIAEVLDLSRLTIEGYTKGIYRKLAVGSRTAAVFEARSLGLLE
ncbi:response regulator transcription factor [Luteimonas sp. RD2P54]|uniref:Response regulator transcription factor n=1 Tax=Luteimonas endophytica TaxID=3042023 RepID=A0ABT6J6G7_9GAMM|nr:response regulator transcription factor [Luteimonas endophytica]MDH5822434.1 response regulator transcription factor [Luteimonas endophytica]